VFKAVYIEKRTLKWRAWARQQRAARFVSLTENVLMVAMAIWMLLRARLRPLEIARDLL
jgi:hypothetical protein